MKSVLRIGLSVLTALILWRGITAYVGIPIYPSSPSMEPTLPVGRHLWMDKWTLSRRQPRRGEIIVFRAPDGSDIEMIKRVIAIPGDKVAMKDKKVILNGSPLEEPYAQYLRPDERLRGDTMEEIVVSPRSVFVLGDNRDVSNDATTWTDPDTGERVQLVPYAMIRGIVRGSFPKYDLAPKQESH